MPRLQTQSNPPSDDCGQYDSSGEVSGEFVVARYDTTPIIQAAKCPFDQVPTSVGGRIERVEPLSGRVLFDLWRGAPIRQKGSEPITVIGGVAQQCRCGRDLFHQVLGGWQIVTVPFGQAEGDDAAFGVGDGMDFRRSTASAATNCLLLSPPFPPAAQRWALAVVLSIL